MKNNISRVLRWILLGEIEKEPEEIQERTVYRWLHPEMPEEEGPTEEV